MLPNSVRLADIQGRKISFGDIIKNMFKIVFFFFKLGKMRDMTKLYILIPVNGLDFHPRSLIYCKTGSCAIVSL